VLLVVTALGGVGLPALAADRRPMAALPATVAGVPQQVAPRVTRPAGTPPVTAFPVVRAGLGTPEPGTGYQPQVTCDPRVRPGVAAFRQLMLSTYGGADAGITRACTRAGSSEHEEGRAWDWQLSAADPAQRAVGDAVLDWLMAPGPDGSWAWQARRFGIMYVIWNGRIWGVYRADEGWRAYRGSDPHTTHVHFSFSWDGALKRTSWWTGRAVTTPDLGPCVPNPAQMAPRYTGRVTSCPPPAPSPVTVTAAGRAQPVLAVGSRGGPVRTLQQLVGVSADGIFGPVTEKALRSWQAAHGLAPTGIADAATWTVLLSAAPARGATSVRMSPAAPSTARSPSPGASPVPRPAVRTPSLDQLRYGASGPAVRALQARLVGRGLLAPARATGSYDRATRSAVAAFQRAQGWRGSGADGLVGPLTVARLWA
jgi:peptidoglycan hydrolase-like protein with peptidoglycan-binding domain